MSHVRAFPALLLLVLALLAPAPAAADGFRETFRILGWKFLDNLGDLNSTGSVDLLMVNLTTNKLGVFHSGNGSLVLDLPAWDASEVSWQSDDVNGDGNRELFLWRAGSTPRLEEYRYVPGSGLVLVFSGGPLDRVNSMFFVHLRSTTTKDAIEIWDDDIRVRDPQTGAVVWRASTAIAGWTGTNAQVLSVDVDRDGRQELLVQQGEQGPGGGLSFVVIRYSAGVFQQLWGQAGWLPYYYFNGDDDPQLELAMLDLTDYHLRLADGVNGATDLDLPSTSSSTDLRTLDTDADGRDELYLQQASPGLFQCLRWNGTSYATVFSHTDPIGDWYASHTRSAAQFEFVEVQSPDVRIRDTAGNVLFRASTGIPGWSVTGPLQCFPFDVDRDGIAELLMADDVTTRLVRYDAGTYTQAWAITGSRFAGDLSNTDDDVPSELMFLRQSDDSYELRDGATGAVQQSWPQFVHPQTAYTFGDFVGIGRSEIVFFQPSTVPGASPTPQTSVHYWTVNGFFPRFTISDGADGIAIIKMRSGALSELMEFTSTNDFLIRDPLTGGQLYKGSNFPGWAGASYSQVLPLMWWPERDQREILLGQPWGTAFLRRDLLVDVGPPSAPTALRVFPSAPNPFRRSTTLRFETPRAGVATLRILDAAGRLVRRLDRPLAAGAHSIAWDGLDERGDPAPVGVLFLDIAIDGVKQTSKIVRVE